MALKWLIVVLALTSGVMADVEPRPQTPGTPAPTASVSEELAAIRELIINMDSKISAGVQALQEVYRLESKLGYMVTMVRMIEDKVDEVSSKLENLKIKSDENSNKIQTAERNIVTRVRQSCNGIRQIRNMSCEDTSKADMVSTEVADLTLTIEKLVNQSDETVLQPQITECFMNITDGIDKLERKCLTGQTKIIRLIATESKKQLDQVKKLQSTSELLVNQLINASLRIESLQGGLQSQDIMLGELSYQLKDINRTINTPQPWCPESSQAEELIILNRADGSVDFYRNWTEYKTGFGNLEGEFWLGLECLNRITNVRQYGLRVDFHDWEGSYYRSRYSYISVGGEADKYRLSVSGYDESSTGGDSLSYHNNRAFSTYDQYNNAESNNNCAEQCKGAWWYGDCHHSNPTGLYLTGGQVSTTGITWYFAKRSYYSYKSMRLILIPA